MQITENDVLDLIEDDLPLPKDMNVDPTDGHLILHTKIYKWKNGTYHTEQEP